jgi:integrase
VFAKHDVKNRVRLETVFGAELTKLVDDYIQNHLHVLLRGANEPWLFPGLTQSHKNLATLSSQITKLIQKVTGLRITVHQFRHAAAALILKAKPGNCEYAKRILGHRNIQTTINFYVGLRPRKRRRSWGNDLPLALRGPG